MLGTAYWPTYLARLEDWDAELLRPSQDIPTIVIFTGSPAACSRRVGSVTNNLCEQMEEAVEMAVGAHPGRLRVVREPRGSVSPVPQLQVFFRGVQQPEALISPNRRAAPPACCQPAAQLARGSLCWAVRRGAG